MMMMNARVFAVVCACASVCSSPSRGMPQDSVFTVFPTPAAKHLLDDDMNKCVKDGVWVSCFRFKTYKYLQDLATTLSPGNISEAVSKGVEKPYLVTLSKPVEVPVLDDEPWRDHMARADKSLLGQVLMFLADQMDTFTSRHGLLIPVSEEQEGSQGEPTLIELPSDIRTNEHCGENMKCRSSRGKLKRYAVVFPLLILLKFFKIKMILLPMMLSILFIKKMLIFILAGAPTFFRLFNFCRPGLLPPQYTQLPQIGLTPASILQEVPDNRGEFASVYGLTSPYRDQQSYRTRPIPSDIVAKEHNLYGEATINKGF